MRKSLTLIELIIAIVLVGVFVLTAFGLLTAATGFYTSSDTRTVVLNDLNYLLSHIDKNVFLSTGWVGNPAVVVDATGSPDQYQITINQFNNPNVADYNALAPLTYDFNTATNQVRFRRGAGAWQTLSRRLVQNPGQLDIDFDADTGVLIIDNLSLRLDPSSGEDSRQNPEIITRYQKFSSWMHSLN